MNARRIYVSLRISVVLFGSMHVTLWTGIMRLIYLASINKNDVLMRYRSSTWTVPRRIGCGVSVVYRPIRKIR